MTSHHLFLEKLHFHSTYKKTRESPGLHVYDSLSTNALAFHSNPSSPVPQGDPPSPYHYRYW